MNLGLGETVHESSNPVSHINQALIRFLHTSIIQTSFFTPLVSFQLSHFIALRFLTTSAEPNYYKQGFFFYFSRLFFQFILSPFFKPTLQAHSSSPFSKLILLCIIGSACAKTEQYICAPDAIFIAHCSSHFFFHTVEHYFLLAIFWVIFFGYFEPVCWGQNPKQAQFFSEFLWISF